MNPLPRRQFLRTTLTAGACLLSRATAAGTPAAVAFLTPADKSYAAARRVFNSTILTRPAIIARCQSEAGVVQALARAAKEKMPVAVKSGGHSFEGFCLNDGGLVVDVSPMKSLSYDSKSGVLTAGGGCRLADVNGFLLKRGRLLPSGSCAAVGLSGLLLGGGYGMFARQFGLTCDHLQSLRMVDAAGTVHDTRDDAELLWACRGGGNGHFGVVTEMRLETRPAPKLFRAAKFRATGLTEARATALLEAWFEVSAGLTENAFSAFVLNGRALTILVTTTGLMTNRGMVAFTNRLTSLGLKLARSKDVPLAQALPRYYGEPGPLPFKNGSGGYYPSFAALAPALPGLLSELFTVPGLIFQVNTLGGAITRGPESAYPHRAFPWLGEWQGYWDHPGRREKVAAAAGRMRDHLTAAGVTRHYANYPDLAFRDWQTAYYDNGYARLQKLKRTLDPDNRFRHPQSVRA